MTSKKRLQQRFGLTLIVLLLAGCGGAPVPTVTRTPASPSSTPISPTATNAARLLGLLSGATDVSTNETNFVDMPDMTASISVPGQVPTCITATFSGMFQAGVGGVTGQGSVHLRALLDDILMEGHNAFDEIGEPILAGFNIFRSYTFWKCDVPPGAHTVRIQWHTHEGAPALGSRARTLVVEGE